MKVGLFILSLLGFAGAAYNLSVTLTGECNSGHLIYIAILAVLMCNCALGVMMTYPEAFSGKRKFR